MIMTNYDQSVEIDNNPNWPYILDHPNRISIIRGSGSGKTNVLLNLTRNHWPGIDKIHWYVKDSFESKYQFIDGREKVGIEKIKKHPLIIHKQLIITMKKIGDYNSTKKKTVLIVFDDMIEDMESNKN